MGEKTNMNSANQERSNGSNVEIDKFTLIKSILDEILGNLNDPYKVNKLAVKAIKICNSEV